MSSFAFLIVWVLLLASFSTFNVVRGQEPGSRAEESSSSDTRGSVVGVGANSSPSTLASALLMSFDTVVLGEFESIPPELEKEPLEFRMVSIPFSVSRSFKGTRSVSLEVDLMSDMLVYPGDDVSRYVKRIQLRETLGEELRDVRAEVETLEQSLASGVISRQQYETERSEKAKLEDELLKQLNNVGLRRAVSIHMETFYDRGGALRQGTTYLIGLNQSGELEELPSNTNVYWGSKMEDIVNVLDE